MRKDLQKRIFTVAAILDRTASVQKTALESDKQNFWKKFFYKETPTVEQPAENQEVKKELPKIRDDKSNMPTAELADFLKGGPMPIEIANAFTQVAKVLAEKGAVAGKDAKFVIVFLAKMLRKYLSGGKVASVESFTDSDYKEVLAETKVFTLQQERKARIAAREAMLKQAVLTKDHVISNDGGYHYKLEKGKDPKNSENWETEVGYVKGLYRGNINIDGSFCVMFEGADGNMYAVLRQSANIEAPAAKEAKKNAKAKAK